MSAQPHRTVATGRGAKASRVTRGLGIATAATLLTAGCAAGQIAQTAYQKASIDGTNTSIGRIDIRAVAIEAPPSQQPYYRPGTAAPLTVVFVNNGRTADQLTGVRTSAASGWGYFTNYNDAHAVEQAAGDEVTGAPSASASESASESSSSTTSGSSTGAPSSGSSSSESSSTSESSSESSSGGSSSSSSALPTGATSITIPAGGRAAIATPDSDAALLLTGVARAIYPGNTVNITFTFAKAGTITVAVPVQVATLGRAAEVTGAGEAGE